MDVVLLIGRALFVGIFLISGIAHLTQTQAMAGYAASRGVPAARPATLVSGAVIVVGGLMVLLGLWGDLGALLIVAFLLPTGVLMHGFWKETDPQAKQMEMVQFTKDTALAGAALAFIWVFQNEPGLTLTGPLF